ncbi:polymorphic toxin-type HINT domain-containing protein [Streptomyces sp. NPDC006475]|uniref:polymorphic toxin-type HINT domain-containing protein n=1 Tax=Streptomyces sp. NPDC006475 TaxID=3155719 RepID=UPI00339F1644
MGAVQWLPPTTACPLPRALCCVLPACPSATEKCVMASFRPFRPSSRLSRRSVRRGIVVTLGVALATAVLPQYAPEARAAGKGGTRPEVQQGLGDPVEGRTLKSKPHKANPAEKAKVTSPAKITWPAPGSSEVTLDGAKPVTAKSLPIEVGPPEKQSRSRPPARSVRVTVADRKQTKAAGIDGVLMTVAPTDKSDKAGSTRLTLDYAGFADAYGAGYGTRLHLVQYPACLLTTPGKDDCSSGRPLTTANNTAKQTLSADVSVAAAQGKAAGGATVLAAEASTSGDQGSFGATPLAPSADWNVSYSSGAFNWSYPMRTPPAPGGLVPQVTLGYDSQSVDGETAATNNQGSWIGQGFSYEPGFIERRYKPCADDGHADTNGDQCWAYDNATLQMAGGSSGELIKDDTTGEWRVETDDNLKVERLTGDANGDDNGDDNGEHWRVTNTDGTQYYFGLENLPGYASGKEKTGSTWTVPVYGDDPGEPCYNSILASAHCTQAWRWNLDYVVDPHGNAMSYFYGKETNHYTQGLKTGENGKPYIRGGYLERIDYGQRYDNLYDTAAPARVVFTTDERCLGAATDCEPGDLTDATATRWPDVPWDLNCKADTKCEGQNSPTFWTRKKLSKVTTKIRNGTGYADVDSWTLGHFFTDNGDSSQSLWLNTITQTGHAGSGTVAMPPVELVGQQLPNRVDKAGDNIQAMNRFRLSGVDSDTGGLLDIVYRDAECSAGNLPATDASTKACYPVKWNPPGTADPITDWFHKYLVHKVIQTDLTGGAPDTVTEYEYIGDAGWKKARADGITKDEYRTYSDWRGYGKTRVTKSGGTVSPANQRTEHTFLRGLGGEVTDSMGIKHADDDDLSGFELETTSYNGAFTSDKIVSKSISTAWQHTTATRKHDWGTRTATYVRPATTSSYTALEGGGWRETKSTVRYDDTNGRVTQTDDYAINGDGTDNQCTRTWYADNAAKHMLTLVSRVETVAVTCADTPDRKTQLIKDDLTFYDGKGLGEAPTKGDTTKVQRLASHDGTNATYETVTSSAVADFDQYGRPLKVTDASGSATTTAYTETDGLTTLKVETNPLGWTAKTEYVRSWGAPAAQTDMNGKRSELGYDALGRLTSVWLPDRPKGNDFTPSIKYTYLIRKDDPVAVKTEKIEKDGTSYGVEFQLYDGLLRPRQKQTEGPDGGRMVADSFYDGVGNLIQTNADYYAEGAPTDSIFDPTRGVDGQSVSEYDGAGRKTADIFKVADEEKWRTTYTYGGDRVHTDPPAGTVPTTVITDGRDHTKEIRRYKGDKPLPAGTTADYESTTYTYTPTGQLKAAKDPAGNVWSYGYDQRGRKTSATDPDTGSSSFGYDALDRLTSTTDARGKKYSTKYDVIGRPVATWDGEPGTGIKLTATTYDTLAKGQVYGTYRYAGGVVQSSTLNTQLDEMYQPTVTQVTLAGSEATELKGTYEFGTQYNQDGTVQSVRMPAAGGLPSETLTYSYDSLQRPKTMTSSLGGSYVGEAAYAPTSQLQQLVLGEIETDGRQAWLTYSYEQGSDRLTNSRVDVEGVTAVTYDADYTYDPSGNVTSIADTPTGGPSDVQCFTHDWQQRLKAAWSTSNSSDGAAGSGKQNAACTSGATGSTIGGPAPYWHTFDYDTAGNRTSQVLHGVSSGPDVTRTYTYGNDASGNGGPHTLTKVVQNTPASGSNPAVTRQDTFTYDKAGNTQQRILNGNTQALAWNSEGKLATAGADTSYVYDAGGGRLLRKEKDKQTLYLPGMELSLNTATRAVEGTRYYTFADQTVALRTSKGVKFLAGDHHGSMSTAIDARTGEVTRRRMDPFGVERGAGAAPWVDDKGFLNKPVDTSTGLTHIGAREYEAENGRFITADPILDLTSSQQINGYAYANNNPVTQSDPTGLCAEPGCPTIDAAGINHTPLPRNSPHRTPWHSSTSKAAKQHWAVQARAESNGAKDAAIAAAKELAGIIADELGVTDALDCFTTGSMGACGATALNAATSVAGGVVGKLAKKYGLPWKWKKAYALGKRVVGLVDDIIDNFKAWRKFDKTADKLESIAKKADPDQGVSCLVNSFTPDTRVLMADGTTKAIKDIRIGDKVIATDPKTGKRTAKTVTAEIKGQGVKDLVKISLNSDDKHAAQSPTKKTTVSVTATDGHPFWVPELGKWIDATDLRAGEWLQTSAGTRVQISSVERWTVQRATVHNLTVADTHTYYAVAGSRPVLVHNCGTGAVSDNVMDEHILPRHDSNHADSWKWAEKSKFEDWVTPDHIRNWAKLSMRKPMDNMNLGTGSAHRHILDIGSRHPIGYDADGNDLFSVAVWVRNGAVQSVHPN